MIEQLKPKTIVVDGSNYISYINRWQKTTEDKGVKFYNVNNNGYFKIE
jgi:competence protein ComEC